MERPSPEFPQRATNDRLLEGCLMGFAIQVLMLLLPLLAGLLSLFGKDFWIWGILQTLGIVPLAFYQRSKGKRRVVQGLILTACLGVLLCSACAALFFPARFS